MIQLDDAKIQAVSRGFHIPAKPDYLDAVNEEVKRDEPDIENISKIISKDIGLSALTLKTINSPIFGMARTIGDIRQASVFLGLDQLSRLITLAALKREFAGEACISLERFWDQSLEVAIACTWFGEAFKSKIATDELYALGLFHDIGIAAMALKYADYVDVLRQINKSHLPDITSIEQNRYQTDHSTVGYFVAVSWNLPKDICTVILNHHEGDFLHQTTVDRARLSYAILKCAESAVDYFRYQHFSNDWFHVREACLDELEMDEQEFVDLADDFAQTFNN